MSLTIDDFSCVVTAITIVDGSSHCQRRPYHFFRLNATNEEIFVDRFNDGFVRHLNPPRPVKHILINFYILFTLVLFWFLICNNLKWFWTNGNYSIGKWWFYPLKISSDSSSALYLSHPSTLLRESTCLSNSMKSGRFCSSISSIHLRSLIKSNDILLLYD